MEIPARMYTSEVVKLAKVGKGTLKKRQREGLFPLPVDRGRQEIYLGRQVYEALGIIGKDHNQKTAEQRWEDALGAIS